MTKSVISLFLIFFMRMAYAQQEPNLIGQNYEQYKESLIKNRLFKHNDLQPLIQKHVQNGLLQDEIIAQSVDGRSIHHLTTGKGKTKVLLWSQMHGDESTATMALFDLFNFLSANDQYNPLRKTLLDNLEIHFVPMLNPDGAQVWTRRNSMDIDLNRDAQNLATPEAKALMILGKKLKPEFGFNLHDQSTLYAAGKSAKYPATISFLAPAFNVAKDMNPVRTKAVQVIAAMNNAIQPMIPNQVAKYNDTFDFSCFGDTFQWMGISAMLIESGGYANDPEKQYIRKVNFYAILTALNAIATQSYLKEDVNNYWSLPNNDPGGLHDLIIRNVTAGSAKMSIGINRIQQLSTDLLSINYAGRIIKTSRLDSTYAYGELDASDLDYLPGKTKEMSRSKWEKMKPAKELRLIKSGYLFVKWTDGTSPVEPLKNRLLNLTNSSSSASETPVNNSTANFLLAKKNKPKYAVINGFLINISDPANPLSNTMGY